MEMTAPRCPQLYVIADRALFSTTDQWLDALAQVSELLCEAPLSALQVRAKDPSGEIRVQDLQRARKEITPAMEKGLRVLGNTTLEHAVMLGFSGVHLSEARQRSLPPLPTERPEGFLIGASAHNAEALQHAAAIKADFAVLSPVHAPFSKPGAGMGLEKFEGLTRAASLPVLALGGVAPLRVGPCMRAGAAGVSVVSALLKSENPRSTLQAFELELKRASTNLDSQKGDNNVI